MEYFIDIRESSQLFAACAQREGRERGGGEKGETEEQTMKKEQGAKARRRGREETRKELLCFRGFVLANNLLLILIIEP